MPRHPDAIQLASGKPPRPYIAACSIHHKEPKGRGVHELPAARLAHEHKRTGKGDKRCSQKQPKSDHILIHVAGRGQCGGRGLLIRG